MTNANKALGKDDFAYTILEAGLASEPDNADIHNLLGFSARKMGRYEDNMKHYQKALAINPKHEIALEYMGELYRRSTSLMRHGHCSSWTVSGCHAKKNAS